VSNTDHLAYAMNIIPPRTGWEKLTQLTGGMESRAFESVLQYCKARPCQLLCCRRRTL